MSNAHTQLALKINGPRLIAPHLSLNGRIMRYKVNNIMRCPDMRQDMGEF